VERVMEKASTPFTRDFSSAQSHTKPLND
jgi:hypothetical protein